MANSTLEEMTINKQNQLIINSKIIIDDWRPFRPYTVKTKLNAEIATNSRKITKNNNLEIEELMKLAEIDSKEYISKLIDLNFMNDTINKESFHINYSITKSKDECWDRTICFEGSNYKVYFVDDAVEYYANKINELKARRIKDSYNYSTNLIDSMKVKNLVLEVSDGFDFMMKNYCLYSGKENSSGIVTLPRTLCYHTDLDRNCMVNDADIENMLSIIDTYTLIYGPIRYFTYTSDELLASSSNRNGDIKIKGINKAPELVKKISSLQERN